MNLDECGASLAGSFMIQARAEKPRCLHSAMRPVVGGSAMDGQTLLMRWWISRMSRGETAAGRASYPRPMPLPLFHLGCLAERLGLCLPEDYSRRWALYRDPPFHRSRPPSRTSGVLVRFGLPNQRDWFMSCSLSIFAQQFAWRLHRAEMSRRQVQEEAMPPFCASPAPASQRQSLFFREFLLSPLVQTHHEVVGSPWRPPGCGHRRHCPLCQA